MKNVIDQIKESSKWCKASEEQIKGIVNFCKTIEPRLNGEVETFYSGGSCYHIFVQNTCGFWIGFHFDTSDITISSMSGNFDYVNEITAGDWAAMTNYSLCTLSHIFPNFDNPHNTLNYIENYWTFCGMSEDSLIEKATKAVFDHAIDSCDPVDQYSTLTPEYIYSDLDYYTSFVHPMRLTDEAKETIVDNVLDDLSKWLIGSLHDGLVDAFIADDVSVMDMINDSVENINMYMTTEHKKRLERNVLESLEPIDRDDLHGYVHAVGHHFATEIFQAKNKNIFDQCDIDDLPEEKREEFCELISESMEEIYQMLIRIENDKN